MTVLTPDEIKLKLRDTKFQREMWGFIMMIMVIPFIQALLDVGKDYYSNPTNVVNWSILYTVIYGTIGPSVLIWMKKNFNSTTAETDDLIKSQTDKITAFNIEAQQIDFNHKMAMQELEFRWQLKYDSEIAKRDLAIACLNQKFDMLMDPNYTAFIRGNPDIMKLNLKPAALPLETKTTTVVASPSTPSATAPK